jgi:hypothetical protein
MGEGVGTIRRWRASFLQTHSPSESASTLRAINSLVSAEVFGLKSVLPKKKELRLQNSPPEVDGRLAGAAENCHQLLRRYYFQLRVGAVLRMLVGAPSAKLRHVAEAIALHMLVSHFDNQFRS